MRSAVVAALVAGTLLRLASVALAHDLFLKLDTYFLEPRQRTRQGCARAALQARQGGLPGGRGSLRVRCLVDGHPVANQTVLWSGEQAGQTLAQRSIRTDPDGVAAVTFDGAGRWYVKIVHMARATERGLDYESKWATLTFEIR